MIPRISPSYKVCQHSELDRPLITGSGRIRAYCHLHGSDHQRSLSIDPLTGWGHCFCCQATILVEDLHPAERVPRLMYVRQQRQAVLAQRIPLALQPSSWQQDEVQMLRRLHPLLHIALLRSERACAYLAARAIPIEIAQQTGVGYLSHDLLNRLSAEQRGVLHRWADRMIFPLSSPMGMGFIGRSLWQWQPDMDELTHARLLEAPDAPRRWLKTNPAGWFDFAAPHALHEQLILVEGGFDRLALLAAGMAANQVVALGGTAVSPRWLRQYAPQVQSLILALDSDSAGMQATTHLLTHCTQAGLRVQVCHPPHDGWGKDWSERYRRRGPSGLATLFTLSR